MEKHHYQYHHNFFSLHILTILDKFVNVAIIRLLIFFFLVVSFTFIQMLKQEYLHNSNSMYILNFSRPYF